LLEFSFGNGKYAHACKVLDVFLPACQLVG
jgi:hypothetical protein